MVLFQACLSYSDDRIRDGITSGSEGQGTPITFASRHSLRTLCTLLNILFLPCRYNVVDDLCFCFFLDFVWIWFRHCTLEVELPLIIRGKCAGTTAVEKLIHKRVGGSLTICI